MDGCRKLVQGGATIKRPGGTRWPYAFWLVDLAPQLAAPPSGGVCTFDRASRPPEELAGCLRSRDPRDAAEFLVWFLGRLADEHPAAAAEPGGGPLALTEAHPSESTAADCFGVLMLGDPHGPQFHWHIHLPAGKVAGGDVAAVMQEELARGKLAQLPPFIIVAIDWACWEGAPIVQSGARVEVGANFTVKSVD